jgi:hypothetical protein
MAVEHVYEMDGRRVTIVHPGKPGKPQRAAEAPDASLPRYMRRVRTKPTVADETPGVRSDAGNAPAGRVPAPAAEVARPASQVTSAERNKAKDVLDAIGNRFSENRLKSQGHAYQIYQKDLAENAHFLIAGGLLTLKEFSEMLLKLEEYRKQSQDRNETPATLLARWLRGEGPEIPAA